MLQRWHGALALSAERDAEPQRRRDDSKTGLEREDAKRSKAAKKYETRRPDDTCRTLPANAHHLVAATLKLVRDTLNRDGLTQAPHSIDRVIHVRRSNRPEGEKGKDSDFLCHATKLVNGIFMERPIELL